MNKARRRVYRAAALFYLALFAAVIWPVYPRFATIEPRVLEMPFSLAYVVGALLLSFLVLLGLYLWEGDDDETPPDGSERFHAAAPRPDGQDV